MMQWKNKPEHIPTGLELQGEKSLSSWLEWLVVSGFLIMTAGMISGKWFPGTQPYPTIDLISELKCPTAFCITRKKWKSHSNPFYGY